MEVPRFDRHANMDSETRSEILNCIRDLHYVNSKTFNIENMLYGLFDGYDYSNEIIYHPEFTNISLENKELHNRIAQICKLINAYPKTNQ